MLLSHCHPLQYYADAAAGAAACSELYESLNLVVRRDSKENNFKGVLETMRYTQTARCYHHYSALIDTSVAVIQCHE
jgi:Intron-binding protein aquarius N-terminus